MANLEDKIANLKREIAAYAKTLAEATTPEEKKDLRQLITSRRDVLKELLAQQREQARGKVLFLRRSSLVLNNALPSGPTKGATGAGGTSTGNDIFSIFSHY